MDIITVRMHGPADNSPLEMISAARLAYLRRVEAAAKRLVAALKASDFTDDSGTPSVPQEEKGQLSTTD